MTARRVAAGCVTIGLALLLTALVVGLTRPHVVAGTARLPAPTGRLPTSSAAQPVRVPVVAPARTDRIRLARLHLDAPIVPVRLTGTVMQVPRNPARVGWWSGGAVPGSVQGSAVLVGHVNYAGTSGAFAVLPRMRPGDRLVLTRPALRYRVVAVRIYPKTSGIPASSFADDGPARLVLITCGGDFDPTTGNYVDNVVVFAVQD